MSSRFFLVAFYAAFGLAAAACRGEEDPAAWFPEVLAAEVRVPVLGQATAERLSELLGQAARVPGVEQVAVVDVLPGTGRELMIRRESGREAPGILRVVSPGYFEIVECDLLLGRRFSEADTEGRALAAVVSESWARMAGFTGNEGGRLIGQRVQIGRDRGVWLTIVGIVEDGPGIRAETRIPEVYVPHAQHVTYHEIHHLRDPAGAAPWYVLVRVPGSREEVAAHLREVLGWEVRTLEERVKAHLEGETPK